VHNEQEHEQHCCDDKDGKEAFHLLLFVDRTNEGTRQTKFKRRSQPFFGTLVIKISSSRVAISFRAAVVLIELEPIPDVSRQPVKCVARRKTNNAESADRSAHTTSPGQCR
jgi:hypothetical protein